MPVDSFCYLRWKRRGVSDFSETTCSVGERLHRPLDMAHTVNLHMHVSTTPHANQTNSELIESSRELFNIHCHRPLMYWTIVGHPHLN